MNMDNHNQKKFLEQQLQWTREQMLILDEINLILHEMKEIALYTLEHEVTSEEMVQLNDRLNELKETVHDLEKQKQLRLEDQVLAPYII
ncbi:hypothetical protein ACW2QC_06850 [Virgibacillus sp. FSP13]